MWRGNFLCGMMPFFMWWYCISVWMDAVVHVVVVVLVMIVVVVYDFLFVCIYRQLDLPMTIVFIAKREFLASLPYLVYFSLISIPLTGCFGLLFLLT